jgi:hypothetical protein
MTRPESTTTTYAVAYAPAGPHAGRWLAECSAHCQTRGWRLTVVTTVPAAAVAMVARGDVGVVVVAREEHGARLTIPVEVVTPPVDPRRPRWRTEPPRGDRSVWR